MILKIEFQKIETGEIKNIYLKEKMFQWES